MAENTSPESQTVSIKECAISTVVVYNDRAEVCRRYATKLKTGEQEIIFNCLSSNLDEDSIRVEGQGSAIISEVAFNQTHRVKKAEDKDEKVAQLEQRKEELEAELALLDMERQRLRTERQFLDTFGGEYVRRPTSKESESLCNTIGKELPAVMQDFIGTYSENASTIDKELHALSLKEKALKKELTTIPIELRKLNIGERDILREISVLLDVKEEGEVELRVSYLVRGAWWSPRYDVRVYTEEKAMKISYYGVVRQSTGEDWDNAKLLLSTASATVGGTMPKLGALRVGIKQPVVEYTNSSKRMMRGHPPSPSAMQMMSAPSMSYAMDGDAESARAPPMTESVAEVSTGMTNTTFEILREATIPSDGVGHKVMVGMIDMQPEFSYEAVPKKSAHAYLRAVAVNTSKLAMLKGPSNVFLDNNFICKSELRDVYPGEELRSWLGVDAAVRLTYVPETRYEQSQGFINKTHLTKSTQVIKVKNNHQHEIKIKIKDHVPQSTDHKIKVILTEPTFGKTAKDEWLQLSPHVQTMLTEHNQLVWKLTLGAEQSADVSMAYSLELPRGEEAEYTQVSLPDE